MWRNVNRNRSRFLNMLRGAQSVLVFDTETTGLGPDAKIIQFSAVKYSIRKNGLKEELVYDQYINPGEPLPEKIVELTGITDEMLDGKPCEAEVASEIFGLLSSVDLWSAYNCGFDIFKLAKMAERTGFCFEEKPCLDVLEMARDFVTKEQSESHSLENIMAYLYPGNTVTFHSAIEDVKATSMLLAKFIGMYANYRYDRSGKRSIHLDWAVYNMNARAKSQVRIKLKLSEGDLGDIYWDVIGHFWSCKSTKQAKQLFQEADMENLEQQLMNKYAWKYQARNMEELAISWGKDKKAKDKAAKAAAAV